MSTPSPDVDGEQKNLNKKKNTFCRIYLSKSSSFTGCPEEKMGKHRIKTRWRRTIVKDSVKCQKTQSTAHMQRRGARFRFGPKGPHWPGLYDRRSRPREYPTDLSEPASHQPVMAESRGAGRARAKSSKRHSVLTCKRHVRSHESNRVHGSPVQL